MNFVDDGELDIKYEILQVAWDAGMEDSLG
jgi:hypothetical protein